MGIPIGLGRWSELRLGLCPGASSGTRLPCKARAAPMGWPRWAPGILEEDAFGLQSQSGAPSPANLFAEWPQLRPRPRCRDGGRPRTNDHQGKAPRNAFRLAGGAGGCWKGKPACRDAGAQAGPTSATGGASIPASMTLGGPHRGPRTRVGLRKNWAWEAGRRFVARGRSVSRETCREGKVPKP